MEVSCVSDWSRYVWLPIQLHARLSESVEFAQWKGPTSIDVGPSFGQDGTEGIRPRVTKPGLYLLVRESKRVTLGCVDGDCL